MLRFYVYGFSVREIAEQDNTTMAAVRSLIRRGRSVLRAKLARHDPAGERP